MLPHRITAKLFLVDGITLDPPAFIPLFHRWIQEHTAPGLSIDVADYAHVHQGPGVLLIGHEGDYALDFAGDRPGLLYRGKRQGWQDGAARPAEGLLEARLRLVLGNLLHAAAALQTGAHRAGATAAAFRYRPDEIEWSFPDRLQTPNDASTYQAVAARLAALLTQLTPDAEVQLRQTHPDPRLPLTITTTLAGALTDPWPALRTALSSPAGALPVAA